MLAGPVPTRVVRPRPVEPPDPPVFDDLLGGSGGQAVSTTMAFTRLLRGLVRDPSVGPLVAPIVPDEARTFGLEPLIAETKIYAPEGQRYTPVDADLILRYAESEEGQILQEGITEAGAMATFIALATAYATLGPAHDPDLPLLFDVRVPARRRPGLAPGRHPRPGHPGRLHRRAAPRLQGEGLQHDDGHSPLLASVNPAARIYDPAFAYEIAVIMEDAVRSMVGPEPARRVLVPDALQRELRHAGHARGRPAAWTDADGAGRRRSAPGSCGACTDSPASRRRPPRAGDGGPRQATLLFSGPMWQAAMEAAPAAGRRLGCGRRRLVGDLVLRAARRRAVGRTLEPPPPRPSGARRRTSPTPSSRPAGPSWR